MGLGSFPLGYGPLGHDPALPADPRGNYIPAAPKYDGPNSDLATDADGRVESVHPIDAGVMLAMSVQKGELVSSPTTGNTLLQVRELATPRQQSEVEAVVKAANPIARYLKDGSITIRRIDSEYRANTGALLVTLYYRNNETGRDKQATASGA
jgi:hypothetical protein